MWIAHPTAPTIKANIPDSALAIWQALGWATTTAPVGIVETPGNDVITRDELNAALADVEGASPTKTYTAFGAGAGFDDLLNLDYATDDPNTVPEPRMIQVRDQAGVLRKSWWINESGLLRVNTVRKAEPAAKFHSLGTNLVGAVLEVRDNWFQGAARRWGVNGKGQQLVGPNQVVAGVVVTLAAGAALPADLPDGTIIARTA